MLSIQKSFSLDKVQIKINDIFSKYKQTPCNKVTVKFKISIIS